MFCKVTDVLNFPRVQCSGVNQKVVSLVLLGVYFFSALLVALCFLLKIPPPFRCILPASYFLVCLFFWKQIRVEKISIIISISVILFAIFVSLNFFDTSWDGMSYHFDAIRGLANGWNPVYEYGHVIYNPDNTDLWINYFPKTSWYVGTVFYKTFRDPNVTKASHITLSFSAAAYFFSFLKNYKVSRVVIWGITLATFFNPVFLVQWASNYVDSILYSLFVLSLISAINVVYYNNKVDVFTFLFAVSLLTTTKSSGAFFACVIIIAVSYLAFKKPLKRKLWIVLNFNMVIFSLILGYSPYMTNLLSGRNVFYPLVSVEAVLRNFQKDGKHVLYSEETDQTVDIITYQSNKVKSDTLSPFSQLLQSIKSKPANKVETSPVPKKIFEIEGVETFAATDTRIAGWGPLFLEVVIISLFLLIFAFPKGKERLILLILVFSLLAFPAAWWARYSPMVYYIPVIAIFSAMIYGRHRILYIISYLNLFILIVNNCIVGFVYARENTRLSRIIKRELSSLKSKELYVCRDPRFNIELYFASCGIKVNGVCCEQKKCNKNSWKDITFCLRENQKKDSCSAWKDIIPYLYISQGPFSNSIFITPEKMFTTYKFNYFNGLNKRYYFSKNGNGLHFLLKEWTISEDDGVGFSGKRSDLKLIGLPRGLPVQMDVEIKAVECTGSCVEVFVNDCFIQTLELSDCFKMYDIKVPSHVVHLMEPAVLSFRSISKNKASNCKTCKWKLRSFLIRLSPLEE